MQAVEQAVTLFLGKVNIIGTRGYFCAGIFQACGSKRVKHVQANSSH